MPFEKLIRTKTKKYIIKTFLNNVKERKFGI